MSEEKNDWCIHDGESRLYWKEQREKTLAEADADYICKRDLPSMERDAWVSEMGKTLSRFPQVDAEDWKDSWDGKISLAKHLAQTKHMSDMIDTQYQENRHLIITNRVLTILLIFSTAFGITAALAWLRCQ